MEVRVEGGRRSPDQRTTQMLLAILVTLTIIVALGYGLRSDRKGELIVRHPYNNQYNDATGARELDLEP